jgi:hypothetical protein
MVKAFDPRQRPRPTKVTTKTSGKALNRFIRALLKSLRGRASGLPATFFAPTPSRSPANLAHTWSDERFRSTTA